MKEEDHIYLLQALEFAKLRRGFCAPNPAVGAVVVKNGRVIATGDHWAAGSPHAEVVALDQLSNEEAQGATIYVTLEPCCHWGKTPPCTDLLIHRKLARVVYGFCDPNPQVAGQGAELLLKAGIVCEYLPLPEMAAFYASYKHWRETGRPWVTAKLAMGVNGRVAGPVTITGSELQVFTHQQRKLADAILTTANTIKADDPFLNVRLQDKTYPKPVYILDNQKITPPQARIFQTASRVTLLHEKDLSKVLDQIGQEGIQDLWIEAGGRCFSAFLTAGLVQRAFLYVAPKCLDETGSAALEGDIFEKVKSQKWQIVGNDAVLEMSFI